MSVPGPGSAGLKAPKPGTSGDLSGSDRMEGPRPSPEEEKAPKPGTPSALPGPGRKEGPEPGSSKVST
ncbi:unnamed protein product, partial [Staurois parvus]